VQAKLTEIHWLDQTRELSLVDLAELSGMPEAALRELVDAGTIAPVDRSTSAWVFRADCITVVRTAARLRNDFDLDDPALALALSLLDRIHDLEAQLRDLSARLPRRIR